MLLSLPFLVWPIYTLYSLQNPLPLFTEYQSLLLYFLTRWFLLKVLYQRFLFLCPTSKCDVPQSSVLGLYPSYIKLSPGMILATPLTSVAIYMLQPRPLSSAPGLFTHLPGPYSYLNTQTHSDSTHSNFPPPIFPGNTPQCSSSWSPGEFTLTLPVPCSTSQMFHHCLSLLSCSKPPNSLHTWG